MAPERALAAQREGASILTTHFFAALPVLEGHAVHGLETRQWSEGLAHSEYLSSGKPLTPPVR